MKIVINDEEEFKKIITDFLRTQYKIDVEEDDLQWNFSWFDKSMGWSDGNFRSISIDHNPINSNVEIFCVLEKVEE